MALSSKLLFGWRNVLAHMTLSSSIAAETLHPLTNIVNQTKRRPARFDMTGETTLTITGTTSELEAITAIMIKGHNLASDATVRFRVYADESQGGAVLYDSDDVDGADVIYTIRPWGEMIAGVDPWGSYYDPDSRLDKVYCLALETVQGKSIRIDLTVPSPVGGFVELDKVAVFFGWTPKHNFDWGSSFATRNFTEQTDTVSGGVWAAARPTIRRMDLDFGLMEDQERNRFMGILDQSGMSNDVYVIPDPNAVGYAKFLGASIYRRQNDAGYELVMFDGSAMSASLREN